MGADNPPPVTTEKNVPPKHVGNTHLPADFPTVTHTPAELQDVLLCGPLLRYTGTDYTASKPAWSGSVFVVTRDDAPPSITVQDGAAGAAVELWHERGRKFWRFAVTTELEEEQHRVGYEITINEVVLTREFYVPAREDTMRIMFHSCNGFSIGSDEDSYSGPALWNDVLRIHAENPFHVMVGGGDQVYNDGIRVSGPLKEWTDIKNPISRAKYPWTEVLERESDEWYARNYMDWYSTKPFCHANAQIPQVNIWDDHDIIDGYGSYTDDLMRCPVFRGVGRVAHKYYLLFQHHTKPQGEEGEEDPSWILGATPGKYCDRISRSIYCRLGSRVAFLGVDARAERTRHQINLPETYDTLFSRCESELISAPEVRHLIVLLGVPIAYPRLVWLETFLKSPFLGILRFLNKRFGVAQSFFNNFDGEIDIIDDLDDHYCAGTHKLERNDLVHRFQRFAADRNVRITFLSGDVHLAAIGRFYSKSSLGIKPENDPRYMVNVISSAITNKPPPVAVSNILARRNKVHHLDDSTDEQLLDFFDKDVDGSVRKRNLNTMPRRNYSIIAEGSGPNLEAPTERRHRLHRHAANAVGVLEDEAGAEHPAASAGQKNQILTGDGSLDVAIRVEKKREDPAGETFSYGFAIPPLSTDRPDETPETPENIPVDHQ